MIGLSCHISIYSCFLLLGSILLFLHIMSFFPKKQKAPPEIIPGDDENLPSFSYDSFDGLRLVGAGAFGDVYCGNYKDEKVCIKVLKHSERRSVLREARFLYKLNHKNIVNFYAVDPKSKAIMMEFLMFDFTPCGLNESVSNVSEFLEKIDPIDAKNFEHIIVYIADQTLSALDYLHSKNVAHRDLKPGNILLSNRKYSENSQWLFCREWCEVKVTDYGESWGNIVETSSAMRTHTVNVYKGTPAYMAPEVHGKKDQLSESELKKADIWSLGMLMFALMNPGSRPPYFDKALREKVDMRYFAEYVKEQINKGERPEQIEKYNSQQKSVWSHLMKIYDMCLVNPEDRPDITSLQSCMQSGIKTKIDLSCHQGTVLEKASENHAGGNTFVSPNNDGTSGCSFFALKFGELIYQEIYMRLSMILEWEQLKRQCEDILTNFPEEFNPFRVMGRDYCPDDACKILVENDLLKPCKREFVSFGHLTFSSEGVDDIKKSLDTDGIYVFTMEPYTFLYGKVGEDYFIIDSHAVPKVIGGNDSGLILVFKDKFSCVTWILQRCYYIRPKTPVYQQSISLRFMNNLLLSPLNEEHEYIASASDTDIDDQVDECKSPRDEVGEVEEVEESERISIDLTLEDDKGHSPQTQVHEMKYFGRHHLPCVKSYRRKLTDTESYQLVQSNNERCRKVPQSCKENAVFLIDSTSLAHIGDVKNDMMVFKKNYETRTVKLEKQADGGLMRRRLIQNDEIIKMYVNRNENDAGLIRNIVYFLDGDDKIIEDTIILQYYLNYNIVPDGHDSVEFQAKPHGNSKRDNKFYPSKKSTLEDLKKRVAAGVRVRKIYEDCNLKRSDDADYGDLPRNAKQLYNVKGQQYPMNESNTILGYNHEYCGGEFVWTHTDHPSDLWVIGKSSMKQDLKNSAKLHPISIDPTFNHGAFEVTPFTYKTQLFQSKDKNTGEWKQTLLLGPIILHHGKEERTYDVGFACASKMLDLDKEKFGVLTDGEPALINSIKSNFKKAILGRCTNHFKQNCEDFIKNNIGEIKPSESKLLLEIVFGPNGLVEAADKKALKKQLQEAIPLLDTIETTLLNKGSEYKPRFSIFIKQNDAVLRRMVRDVRIEMGLPLKSDGTPMRTYTNQSECMNSMLKAKKTSLGYGQRTDLKKYQFIKDIYLPMIEEKDEELKKAVYGQSYHHRLSPRAKYLEVDTEYWFDLSKAQREQYFLGIRSLSGEDLDRRKPVKIDTSDDVVPVDNREKLSVSLVVELTRLFYADCIETKALELLNSPNGITLTPTIGSTDPDTEKMFLVASGKKDVFYKVKIGKNNNVSCTCKGYSNVHICSHSVAVAEKLKILRHHVDIAKKGKRMASVNGGGDGAGAGRKGQVKRRKRNYDIVVSPTNQQNLPRPVFTQIWHNNYPLELCSVREIPEDKVCGYCQTAFPSLVPIKSIPYDIAIRHKEKWLYPNQKSSTPSHFVSRYFTYRYYCVKHDCIINRFPYFVKEILQKASDVNLDDSHLKLIKEQFGFDFSQ